MSAFATPKVIRSLVPGLLGAYDPNIIRNPCGLVAQRGTSIASPSTGNYTLDGWYWNNTTSAVVTVTQDTDVPTVAEAGYRIPSSLKVDVTTADASLAAGDLAFIAQKVEGYLTSSVVNGATLQFWVKSPKTGTHFVTLLSGGADRLLPVDVTINATDTWQKVTIPLTAFDLGTGTWNFGTSAGLHVAIGLAAGSTYSVGTDQTWSSNTSAYCTATLNCLDDTANNFFITDVRLVPGSVAPSTPPREYPSDLRLCRRYFFRSDTVADMANLINMHKNYGTAAFLKLVGDDFLRDFRVAPTASLSATSSFEVYSVANGGWGTCGAVSIVRYTGDGLFLSCASNLDAQTAHLFRRNGGSWYWQLSAEL